MNSSATMHLPDCYRILNVVPGVKWETVKKSYRSLALQYHPDLNPDNRDSEIRFKEISAAFQVLETHYRLQSSLNQQDEFVFDFDTGFREQANAGPGVARPDDISRLESLLQKFRFHDLGGKIRDYLEECERKVFVLDIQKDLHLDAKTAAAGGTVRVRQNRETFEVRIPPGAWNRMTLRVPGKGETSWFRNKRGDLVLNILVEPGTETFSGEASLYYDLRISPVQLSERRVQTLNTVEGPIKFVLPGNTTNGQSFVLKARPDAPGAPATRHVVTVHFV